MATPFPVEVLTPEGQVFDGEVELLSTRTSIGSIGIRANHAPLLGMLEPCELRLHSTDSGVVTYAQAEGYIQILENSALLLVEEAIEPDDLDRSTIQSQLDEAQRAAERAEEGSEERHRHERDAKRYEAFLEVAGG